MGQYKSYTVGNKESFEHRLTTECNPNWQSALPVCYLSLMGRQWLHAKREVAGLKTIDGILTTDRKAIEPDVLRRMQYVLDAYKAGVLIRQVQLQSVDAPSQVISAYLGMAA